MKELACFNERSKSDLQLQRVDEVVDFGSSVPFFPIVKQACGVEEAPLRRSSSPNHWVFVPRFSTAF